MGVWAGDDSPSKRDRQPSLCAYTLVAASEAVVPLKRGNKKSVAPYSQTPAGSACAVRSQLSSSFTNPNGGDSLLHERDHYNWLTSVYLLADFVHLQFVTSLLGQYPALGDRGHSGHSRASAAPRPTSPSYQPRRGQASPP